MSQESIQDLNSNLIAAAPELLVALKGVVHDLETYAPDAANSRWATEARAAIAKAEGSD